MTGTTPVDAGPPGDMYGFLDRTRPAVMASWAILLYLWGTAALLFLEGNPIWTGYAAFTGFIAVLPAAALRDWRKVPPPEILFITALPFTLKAAGTGTIASWTLGYLSAAAVALLVIAELDMFTGFETTPRFTVILLTATTIAISGTWAIARWVSDLTLGTGFLGSETLLMWEFTAAALTGVVAGELFNHYTKHLHRRSGDP